MNKILFKHITYGVIAFVDGYEIGNFLTEQDAIIFIILNDYLDVTIERESI